MSTVPVVRFVIREQEARLKAGAARPYTVVFDGDCRVCQRVVALLCTWDRHDQLTILASQTPGVQARFPWIPARAYRESLQLIGPSGRTWQGAAAVEQLLAILPKGRLISWVFKIPLVRTLAERFYRWFARYRYRLGCGEHCQNRPVDLDYRDH